MPKTYFRPVICIFFGSVVPNHFIKGKLRILKLNIYKSKNVTYKLKKSVSHKLRQEYLKHQKKKITNGFSWLISLKESIIFSLALSF